MLSETNVRQKRSESENDERSFFQQAVMKGYETEITNLKKEIEQLQQSTKVSSRL